MEASIDFDVTEAIAKRHSVRTYDTDRPISDEILHTLAQTALSVPNPFGCSEVKIKIVRQEGPESGKIGTYGIIKGAHSFIGLGVDGTETSCLAGGYALETAVLKATSLGLGTCWLGGTLKRKAFYEAFGFTAPTVMPAIAALGYPASKRFAEKALRYFAKSDSRKPWDELFFDKEIKTPLAKDNAGPYSQALANMRLAPSALNSQPWRVVKQNGRLHFYAEIPLSASGLDLMLKYIDMGIAICHFRLTLMQEKAEGTFNFTPPKLELPEKYRYIATWTPNKLIT